MLLDCIIRMWLLMPVENGSTWSLFLRILPDFTEVYIKLPTSLSKMPNLFVKSVLKSRKKAKIVTISTSLSKEQAANAALN